MKLESSLLFLILIKDDNIMALCYENSFNSIWVTHLSNPNP